MNWIRAGDEVIKEDAETVQVALDCGLLPLRSLRVQDRGAFRPGIRPCIVLEVFAGTEVHQDDAPVFGSHHVVRLDIPDVAGRRCAPPPSRDEKLQTYADSFGGADHLPLVEDLFEGVAANELHPQANLIGNLLGTVDGDHVRMPHAGEQAALVDDGGRPAIAGGGICRQEFQRDFAIEPRIPGAVNLSECAAADLLEESKVTPVLRRRKMSPPCGI